MRRTLAATSILAFALVLAGCSNSDDSAAPSPSGSGSASASACPTADPAATTAPTASAADKAALDQVKVNGDAGKEPTLTFPTPLAVDAAVAKVVSPGTGADLKEGQQLTFDIVAYSGCDGSKQGSTYGGTASTMTLGGSDAPAELNDALKGQKVGVRALVTVGTADQTAVYEVEVKSAKDIPARASGKKQPVNPDIPAVTLDSKGAPTIAKPSGKAPTKTVTQTLIKGTGDKVAAGDTITVNYTGWLWDGTKFDSSWDRGTPISTVIGEGQVIPGWDDNLVGQTVGSQVELVITPTDGYGATASGSIPANSTLVFVVDILADTPAAK